MAGSHIPQIRENSSRPLRVKTASALLIEVSNQLNINASMKILLLKIPQQILISLEEKVYEALDVKKDL